MIKITLPDGAERSYAPGTTAMEVAKSISEGLAKKVLAAQINGEVWDATRPISTDASLKLLTWDDADAKSTFWHSSAHVLGQTLEQEFGVQLCHGPPTDSGFFYDSYCGKDVSYRVFSY